MSKHPLSVLRVKKELETIIIGPDEEIAVDYYPDGASTIFYTMHIRDGIYAGHLYSFAIAVPKTYPFAPPKPRCLTKVLHPSIDAEGRVCMNITREDWSIVLSIQTVIFGLSSIFYDVPTSNPLNQEAQRMLLDSPEKYAREARRVYEGLQ